jgi:hypothetical protein
MAKYTRRFDTLADVGHWLEHLRRFEGIRFTVKRVPEVRRQGWKTITVPVWVLTFEHPQFRGQVGLTPSGVFMSSGQVRPIYTTSGRSYAATWQGVLTFKGEWRDMTERSAA